MVIHSLKVFFHHRVAPPFYFFPHQTGWQYSDGKPPNGGVESKRGMKKLRFSTNISLYLANDARWSHSYYGKRIGNCTQAFEWYRFKWPWVTFNPDFKVMISFYVKQAVRLGARHNMPPPRDLDFWPWSRRGSRMWPGVLLCKVSSS